MKKRLLWLALLTLIGFPLLGWAVLSFFKDDSLYTLLRSTKPIWLQLLSGTVLGIILGAGAKFIVTRPFLDEVQKKYSKIIAALNLTEIEIIFISLCAGFGEEILFRGAIQPLIGLWITAIIFVAIHGYLNPKSWRMSIYGIYMTIAIAILGYYTDYVGIIGASMAHAAIDYVLFKHLIKTGKKILPAPTQTPEYMNNSQNYPDNDEDEIMRNLFERDV